jgi:hypothetical protein
MLNFYARVISHTFWTSLPSQTEWNVLEAVIQVRCTKSRLKCFEFSRLGDIKMFFEDTKWKQRLRSDPRHRKSDLFLSEIGFHRHWEKQKVTFWSARLWRAGHIPCMFLSSRGDCDSLCYIVIYCVVAVVTVCRYKAYVFCNVWQFTRAS